MLQTFCLNNASTDSLSQTNSLQPRIRSRRSTSNERLPLLFRLLLCVDSPASPIQIDRLHAASSALHRLQPPWTPRHCTWSLCRQLHDAFKQQRLLHLHRVACLLWHFWASLALACLVSLSPSLVIVIYERPVPPSAYFTLRFESFLADICYCRAGTSHGPNSTPFVQVMARQLRQPCCHLLFETNKLKEGSIC